MDSILRDYFGVEKHPPVCDEVDFERRFRLPCTVLKRIVEDIKHESWWGHRTNATGRRKAHPLQKLVAAFRVLAYVESMDRADEYVRFSRTTAKWQPSVLWRSFCGSTRRSICESPQTMTARICPLSPHPMG